MDTSVSNGGNTCVEIENDRVAGQSRRSASYYYKILDRCMDIWHISVRPIGDICVINIVFCYGGRY